MATIQLVNIVKKFGDNLAVNHVNLEIRDGEFLVLLGPSGCGKTTSLRSIAGLETIDGGDILIDNRRVNDIRPSERDIAFCFQHYALYPHLTAYNNIAFPLRTQKMSKAEIEKRVNEVSGILNINHILKKKPKHLSGGDQQRVALARAMVRQPKAFLMDEPMGTLDAKLRENMRVELRRMQLDSKTTTVYVTHDQVEAMSMADRIAIMNRGHLLQVDTPEKIYSGPANLFVANFIGSPGMNFMPSQYSAQSGAVIVDLGGIKVPYKMPESFQKALGKMNDGKSLIIGIRPEDVLLHLEEKDNGIPLETSLTEPLGSENIVNLQKGAIHIKARTAPSVEYAAGTKVWVTFETAGLNLFDRDSENAIA